MSNINAKIIEGVSKQGNKYKAVQFEILTEQGTYVSPLCFPTPLEINLIQKALSPMSGIYGDASPKVEG